MARKRVVTRTIKATRVTARVIDVTTENIENRVFTLSSIWKDDEKILKKLKKQEETDETKVISIVTKEVIEEKRYMTEEDFITNSVPYADDVEETETENEE